MPQGILRKRRRPVLGAVIFQELVGGLLNRLSLLGTGFLFDDLTVGFLQPLALTALRIDGLLFVGRAGRAAVAASIQLELVNGRTCRS